MAKSKGIRRGVVVDAIEHLQNARLASTFEGASFHRDGEFVLSPSAREFTSHVLTATADYRASLLTNELDAALTGLRAELERKDDDDTS